MSQNIRATPCSAGRQGRMANVLASGMAIMSDSSIGLNPVIDEPSNPIPPSNASPSSVALIENDLSWPRMSVNHRRMKRMSRSCASEMTSSGLRGAVMLVIWPKTLLAGRGRGPYSRPMRFRYAAAGVLVTLAACGSSSAAPHDSAAGTTTNPGATTNSGGTTNPGGTTTPVGASCGPTRAKTLLADRRARVYERREVVFGCADTTRHSYRLGSAETCLRSARAGPIALAGTTVAYGLQRCGIDTGSGLAVVQQLTDGHELRALAATGGRAVEAYSEVTAIVVKSDGAVAWIGALRSIIRKGGEIQVHRADASGEAELDSGPGIGLTSLRRHGSRLTWR